MNELNICRTCLHITNELNNIYTTTEGEYSLLNILMECASVHIRYDDNLPKYICSKCLKLLDSFRIFRSMCKAAENILLSCVNEEDTCDVIQRLREARLKELKFDDEFVTVKTEKLEFKEEDLELKLDSECAWNSPPEVGNNEQANKARKKRRLNKSPGLRRKRKILTEKQKELIAKQKKESRICYICGKLTLSITEHLITHRDARDWKCDKCGKLFSNRVAVRKHQIVHNPSKIHVCERCGTSFATKHTLARHIRTVHYPTKAYECSVCGKRFENAYNLKMHKMKHSGEKPFKCKHCPEQFTCKIKFREHNMQAHNVQPNKLYKCEKCNLTFVYNFQLLAHQKKPEHEAGGSFKCTICNEAFDKQRLYLKHVKLKHSTPLMKKEFNEQSQCNICSKTFKQLKCLRQHEKLHVENGKKFKCEYCGKAFLYNAFLKEHTRIHTGERPAKCNLCNNAYISFRQLKKHLKMHEKTNIKTE